MTKDSKISREGKREVVERLRHRYLQAGRREKSKILDEFVALSGMHRKSSIRARRQGYERGRERRGQFLVVSQLLVSVPPVEAGGPAQDG